MHVPVLVAEVVELLSPGPGQRFVDATIGLGGHAAAVLPRLRPGGLLLGVDRDGEALEEAEVRLAEHRGCFELVQGDFRDLARLVARTGFGPADGVLFDLGASSIQLDRPERGFGFQADAPLDMRMDRSRGPTGAEFLRRVSARELERVLREYGEERYARRIARAVVERRGAVRTTGDLARLIERVVPRRERRKHPATRSFQAIRMAVNDEPGALADVLATLPRWLAPGGRVAAISFHSGEDRAVKQAFRAYERAGVVAVATRKPVRASAAEVRANRRARSARLRVARRLGAGEGRDG